MAHFGGHLRWGPGQLTASEINRLKREQNCSHGNRQGEQEGEAPKLIRGRPARASPGWGMGSGGARLQGRGEDGGQGSLGLFPSGVLDLLGGRESRVRALRLGAADRRAGTARARVHPRSAQRDVSCPHSHQAAGHLAEAMVPALGSCTSSRTRRCPSQRWRDSLDGPRGHL